MSKTVPDKFKESLLGWYLEDGITPPSDIDRFLSTDRWLESAYDPKDDNNFLRLTILRSIIEKKVNDCSFALGRALKLCQSPIESQMLAALTITAIQYNEAVSYSIEGRSRSLIDKIGNFYTIEPQARIGDYKVDFLLTYQIHNYKGEKTALNKLVVECDGHDFHERTKEQAKNDRQRDRALQSTGYQVFRYTGSEIWEDVFKCSKQALTILSIHPEGSYGNPNEEEDDFPW